MLFGYRIKAIWASLIGLLAMVPLLVIAVELAFVSAGQARYLDADLAVMETSILQAASGKLVLGPYSRFGWNHPGPMLSYLFLPLYSLTGYNAWALSWMALLINLVSSIGILVASRHLQNETVYACTALVLGAYLTFLGPHVLLSPWNPYVTILPLAFLLMLCLHLSLGRMRLIPLTALVASFLVQSHLGYLVITTMAVPISLCVGLVGLKQDIATEKGRSGSAPWMIAALALLVVLWLPVIFEQISREPGNLTKIYGFLRSEHDQPRTWDAIRVAMSQVLGLPMFIVAGFGLPIVGIPESALSVLAQLSLTILIAGAGLILVRHRQPTSASLCLLATVGTGSAILAAVNVREALEGYLVQWISVVGFMQMVALGSIVVPLALAIVPMPVRKAASVTALCVGVGALLWIMLPTLGMPLTSVSKPTAQLAGRAHDPFVLNAHLERLSDVVIEHLQQNDSHKPVIKIAYPVWEDAVGVVALLAQSGIPFAIDAEWLFMLSPHFHKTGEEDHQILIVDAEAQEILRHRRDYQRLAQEGDVVIYAADGVVPHWIGADAILVDAKVEGDRFIPGSQVPVQVKTMLHRTTDSDYVLAVRLRDDEETIRAKRVVSLIPLGKDPIDYQGRLATHRVLLPVPDIAEPGEMCVELAFLHASSWESEAMTRLAGLGNPRDSVCVGSILIAPTSSLLLRIVNLQHS